MKYETRVVINRPLENVIKLFADRDVIKKWQSDLTEIHQIEGEAGQNGSIATLIYEEAGKQIEMSEEIVENNLPESYHAVYSSGKVENLIWNRFESQEDGSTLWIQENEFRMKGLMRILAILSPVTFKKQTLTEMNKFKAFAESVVLTPA